MDTIKHAPGPWASAYCGKDTIKIFKPSDKRRIATVKVKSMVLDEANATLIAAAPEMLAALSRLEEAVYGIAESILKAPTNKPLLTALCAARLAIKNAGGN